MLVEIEAKMQITDVDALERKLESVGGKSDGVIDEINTFFDTSSGALKAGDQGLRIRVERGDDNDGPRAIITHKGPRAHGMLKSRAETEVEVNDPRAAAELLSALGFVPVISFEKRRRRWTLDDCSIAIDTLPYLGTYVEIEGPRDASVMLVRTKLELDALPMIRASYVSMLADFLAEHHIRSDFIRFNSQAPTGNVGETPDEAPAGKQTTA